MWLLWCFACPSGADYDQDGWVEPADCDDNDPEAYPGAEERPYDGIDQDCDGTDQQDRDGDGFQAEEAGGPDCNDFNADVYPGAPEIPYDGIDEDCDHWPDDDQDHDGFAARGEGGEDCDDTDPRSIPVDLDGDGYTGCTGDCDEGDPRRNEAMPPICGDGFDDDCDGIGDCTLVGIHYVAQASVRITGDEVTTDLGWTLAAPGDLDGDGVGDLVASDTSGDVSSLLAFVAPFEGERGLDAAYARIEVGEGELEPLPVGDLDGDGRAELFLGAPSVGDGEPRAWLLSSPPPGDHLPSDLALLEIRGEPHEFVGQAGAVIGDRLVVSAPGRGSGVAEVLPLATRGTVWLGDTGGVIVGQPNEFGGGGLGAWDRDGDGVDDLVFAGTGDLRELASAVYVVPDPPRSGRVDVDDVSVLRVDTHAWERAGGVLAHGDLTGDGGDDLAIGAPSAFRNVGMVGVVTEPLSGKVNVEHLDLQWSGVGDDSFGGALVIADYDGDGHDDLVVGAPASWASGGGDEKPGAVHLWYGPVDPVQVSFSLASDLYVEGVTTGNRTQCGHALAIADLDGDGGNDLAIATPWLGSGQIDVLPGGRTGLFGW